MRECDISVWNTLKSQGVQFGGSEMVLCAYKWRSR